MKESKCKVIAILKLSIEILILYTKIKNNKRISILKLIFLISLLYYVFWIILSIYFFFHGIDSGWAMPAMSNGDLMYGFEAFFSGIIIGVLYTIELFWFIPLYQVIYLIYSIIKLFTSCKKGVLINGYVSKKKNETRKSKKRK